MGGGVIVDPPPPPSPTSPYLAFTMSFNDIPLPALLSTQGTAVAYLNRLKFRYSRRILPLSRLPRLPF